MRVSPVENITYLAMMVAFDAILSLLATLIPFSGLFIMLIAPLVSASVSMLCRKRYIPIYILGAIGICLAVTAWDFMNTLFYMIPAVCTGCLYGWLWKVKIPPSISIFLTAILSNVFFLLSILLLRALFDGVDMVEVLLAMIGRREDPIARMVFPLFAFGYSLAQTGISHAFLTYEFRKMGVEEAEERIEVWHPWIGITFAAISVILGYFYAIPGYFFLGVSLYWTAYAMAYALPNRRAITIAGIVISLFVGVFSFAGLYRLMPGQSGLLLLCIPLALVNVFCFVDRFLPEPKQKID